MGKYNSSIHRVRPLMELVEANEHAFLLLLSLVGIDRLGKPHTYRYDGKNCKEMQLKPTKRHLLALIDHLAEKGHKNRGTENKNRQALFFGDDASRAAAAEQAKCELNAHYHELSSNSHPWFVFEGFTNPDIFIEGEDYVIVCEGKWTEPHITTTTTYLSDEGEHRSQMVRHIQGALNYSDKKVYAFYIADANCGYTEALTKASFSAQLEQETIPIDPAEREAILDSFYGYTTWQAIQKTLPGAGFQEKDEIDRSAVP